MMAHVDVLCTLMVSWIGREFYGGLVILVDEDDLTFRFHQFGEKPLYPKGFFCAFGECNVLRLCCRECR